MKRIKAEAIFLCVVTMVTFVERKLFWSWVEDAIKRVCVTSANARFLKIFLSVIR